MSNVKGLLNCLVRFKVTSLRDLAGMAGKRSASPNLFDTEGWPEVKNPKLVRKVKKNMEHQTMEGKTLEKNLVEENIETKKTIAKGCSDCDVLNNSVGDFDKRQDLFSQVIAPGIRLAGRTSMEAEARHVHGATERTTLNRHSRLMPLRGRNTTLWLSLWHNADSCSLDRHRPPKDSGTLTKIPALIKESLRTVVRPPIRVRDAWLPPAGGISRNTIQTLGTCTNLQENVSLPRGRRVQYRTF
ncbi:hypothetical protein ACJJTC_007408 [Scirpophaga incertulas]